MALQQIVMRLSRNHQVPGNVMTWHHGNNLTGCHGDVSQAGAHKTRCHGNTSSGIPLSPTLGVCRSPHARLWASCCHGNMPHPPLSHKAQRGGGQLGTIEATALWLTGLPDWLAEDGAEPVGVELPGTEKRSAYGREAAGLGSPRAPMPVHPAPKEAEEMEGDGDSAPELNGEEEESEEEHSASPSESEEESSEMDEEDCERRRSECLDEMCDLEKQFSELKEKLFKERLNQVKAKLEDVASGRAAEYLDPLGVLQNNMKIRIEVAGIYKGLCLEVVRNKHECELQGAHQHLESEKLLLYDNMQSELLERIQRLEDDRQSIDITSEWWDDKLRPKNSLKKWDPFRPAKRKKAPLVSGPYIVYMLRDIDILEDWTAIKKAKAAVSPQKRKSDVLVKVEKPGAQFSARCEDGRLHYEGEIYSKGQSVILEVGDEAPAQAVITAVSTGEVWLRREDGTKTKIYVSQLQKGKYSVHKA
ncbi:LOW QUALITY PROTEIN: breast cancer metastasis-suppressor 1 [Natator depressus]|uniref:LOW QUALITY PROTEIN: breast cancer metastasis-suppressor 1 n=1 Tax=Natator depressus TaxID=27790 RepID=UPI003EBBDC91